MNYLLIARLLGLLLLFIGSLIGLSLFWTAYDNSLTDVFWTLLLTYTIFIIDLILIFSMKKQKIFRKEHYFFLHNIDKILRLLIVFSYIMLLLFTIKSNVVEARAIIISSFICTAFGGYLFFTGRNARKELYRKEGVTVVALGWLFAGMFGALPFFFSGTFQHQDIKTTVTKTLVEPKHGYDAVVKQESVVVEHIENNHFNQYVNSFFEIVSGFTTTGSTVLTKIEGLDRGLLFWRSMTQWLGGMGIIVLFLAIFPQLGAGGKHLFRSEVPGPIPDGLKPRIKETAFILWKIYLTITTAEVLLLMIGGVDLYNAICHAFTTMATGGYSNFDASIKAFDSVYIDVVITFFMFLAGINFSLYFMFLNKDWYSFFRDPEFKVYVLLLGIGILFVTIQLYTSNIYSGIDESLRYGSFQVVSIMTTTGYCTADFNQWPNFIRVLFVVFMFIGGSSGSTGGGMKVMRVIVLFKYIKNEIYKIIRPYASTTIRIGNSIVKKNVANSIAGFFILVMVIFVSVTLVLCLFGNDIVTSFTATAATLFNIGPGLESVGAVENFAFFSSFNKILLSFCMIMGRLELYTIMILFLPAFWKK